MEERTETGHPTPDSWDQAAWEQELKSWAEGYPEEAARVAGELEAILRQFNTFDILAQFGCRNLFYIADSYEEPLHDGHSAFVEYVTLLALKGDFVQEQSRPIAPEDLDKLQKLATEAFDMGARFRAAQLVDRRDVVDRPLEDVRTVSQIHELMVRAMVYPMHLCEVLSGLFTPFDAELEALAGFTTRSAVQLRGSINTLISGRMQSKVAESKRRSKELFRQVRARKRDSNVEVSLPEDWVKLLMQLPDQKVRLYLRRMAVIWSFSDFGQTVSFTAKDLSAVMDGFTDEIESLLGYLSVGFGSVDSDFYIPKGDHILKKKPMLRHQSRYQVPSEPVLRDAMIPAMQSVVTSERRLKDRYVKHRHDFLLRKGIECLQKILPGASVDTNLYYDSEGERCELDALIRYDTILILLEGKGAPLSPAAKRGAPISLKGDLRKIITRAFRQGFRAHSFLQKGGEEFERRDGSALEVSLGDFREVFTISLHLEQIGHLTSLDSSVEVLDLPIDSPEQFWMVSLYDLMVMSDILDVPSMFPHYLKRRLRISRQRLIRAPEELDFFCYYLSDGLFFERQEFDGMDSVLLTSQTVPLDNYYSTVQGERRHPADKPKQKMPPAFEALVREIEASRLSERTSVNMALLDHGGESRDKFCSEMLKARKQFAEDGKLHDRSTYFKVEGGWGVTFMCGPEEKVLDDLLLYCTYKKEEMDAAAWYGIADCGQESPRICEVIMVS